MVSIKFFALSNFSIILIEEILKSNLNNIENQNVLTNRGIHEKLKLICNEI